MKIALITPDHRSPEHPFVKMIVEGLRAGEHQIWATESGNGIDGAPSRADWIAQAKQADAVFLFFGKPRYNYVAGTRLTTLPEPDYGLLTESGLPRERLAYLDYSELTATGHPTDGQIEAMRTHPELRRGHPWVHEAVFELVGHYFKRECYPADRARGIHPLGFGLLAEYVLPPALHGKDWDLFCCFGHTLTGLRAEIVREVTRLAGKHRGKKIVIKTRQGPRDYKQALARSKVVIDAWGHGDHCYRFWEALGAGACLLYQAYQVEVPEASWPAHGLEAMQFSTMREFTVHAEKLLAEPDVARAIGERGHWLARAQHTGLARVDYILQTMGLRP